MTIKDGKRPSWDETMLAVAREVGKRSTCLRALEAYGGIGAVLVESKSCRVLGMGYCGSLPGQAHCTEVGCLRLEGAGEGCHRTMHAEVNAILFARESEHPKTLYTTVSPCLKCLQIAISKGVARVVFAQLYRETTQQVDLCDRAGVEWVHHGQPIDGLDELLRCPQCRAIMNASKALEEARSWGLSVLAVECGPEHRIVFGDPVVRFASETRVLCVPFRGQPFWTPSLGG